MSSENIIEITSVNDFNNYIDNKKCVIDFWGSHCAPCKALLPVLEELSNTYKDILFLKVEVDKFQEISSRYFVTSLPTILFLDNSKVITQLTGSVNKKKIITEIEKM